MHQRFRVIATIAFIAAASAATPALGAPVPVTPKVAQPQNFAAAQTCGCHQQLVGEWSQSMHAQALTDPIYQTKLAQAQEATDGKLGAFCNTCHGPAATMTGEMGAANMSPGANDAVGCSFCHQVIGNKGEPGNTSQLVTLDGVRRAQLEEPKAPHPAAYSEFHTRAELCGGCHNVNHPINGMHLESTYAEWKKSPYAEQGIVCQDCHMSEAPGKIGPSAGYAANGGPERDNIFHMSFVGAQVALGPADLATARLKSAASVRVNVADIVEPGKEATVTVTVTNKGAGHYLPTGLTEVRRMWLEVYGTGKGGKRVKLAERVFGTVLQDDEGNAPVELWEATSVESDDRIPPKQSVEQTATFTMPEGVDSTTVKALLYYQSVPDELADQANVDNPTTEMAGDSRDVYASDAAKAAVAAARANVDDTSEAGGNSSSLALWIALGAVLVVAVSAAALFLLTRSSR